MVVFELIVKLKQIGFVMFPSRPLRCWLLLIGSCSIALSFYQATKSAHRSESDLNYAAKFSIQPALSLSAADASVAEIARQVTVRILTPSSSGSGVIVERRGQIYTVLTNYHVVTENSDNHYTILTADGKTYSGQWVRSRQDGTLDLALVRFVSSQSYKVAEVGNMNTLSVGDTVYACGFPAWDFTKQGNTITALNDTRDWGTKAFRITNGQIKMISRALQGGYQIGYTNDVLQGMSGGAVLNQKGQIIGINGKLKYPFQGIRAFIFADGQMPSEQLFRKMESLNWAIPISTFTSETVQKSAQSGVGL